MAYFYNLKLQGHAKDDKPSLRFRLVAADEAEALASATAIRAAFLALSSVNLRGDSITNVINPDGGVRPTDPAADGFEEARVTVYLDATGDKLHTLRIPGADNTVYLPDGQTVDITNAFLTAYVAVLAEHVEVSDGEAIDETITNGIKEGWKGSKAVSFK